MERNMERIEQGENKNCLDQKMFKQIIISGKQIRLQIIILIHLIKSIQNPFPDPSRNNCIINMPSGLINILSIELIFLYNQNIKIYHCINELNKIHKLTKILIIGLLKNNRLEITSQPTKNLSTRFHQVKENFARRNFCRKKFLQEKIFAEFFFCDFDHILQNYILQNLL